MKHIYLKKFAILFSLLVLLQEVQGKARLIEQKQEEDEKARSRRSANSVPFEEEFMDLAKQESLEEVLDEYIELTRKELIIKKEDQEEPIKNELETLDNKKNENELETHDNKKRWLTTFLLVNGVINAAFDVYKYEAGCTAWTTYVKNLNTIKTMIPVLVTKRDNVNLAWNTFHEKYQYYERLHSQAVIFDSIALKYEQYKYDILMAIDPDIEAKLANASVELKNEITALNITGTVDYSYLEAAFLTKFQLAYSLIKNLKSIAWMAGKAIVSKIIELTSSGEAADFVNENPSSFQRFLDYASEKKAQISGWYDEKVETLKLKIEEFKLTIKTKVIEFIESNPKLNSAYEYLKGDEASRARWVRIKNGLVTAAKVGIAIAFVGYDIYLLAKFVKECDKRQSNSQTIVNELNGNATRLDQLQAEVVLETSYVEGNYTELKAKFTDGNFTKYVISVRDLLMNSTDPTANQVLAIAKLNTFLAGIAAADYSQTDVLVEGLIEAFYAANIDFDCLQRKLHIIQDAYQRCSSGYDTFANIYTYAKARETKDVVLAKHCVDAGYLTESELKDFIYSQLADYQKQNVCMRNSVDKLNLACALKDANTQAVIATRLSSTVDDVIYFISQCPLLTLTSAEQATVCTLKKNLQTVSNIIANYFPSSKYLSSHVTTVYGDCAVPDSIKVDVCQLKADGFTTTVAQGKYSSYSSSAIGALFTGCAPTTFIINRICMFKLYFTLEKTLPFFTHLYTTAVITQIYADCPTAQDETDKAGTRKINEGKYRDDEENFEALLRNIN